MKKLDISEEVKRIASRATAAFVALSLGVMFTVVSLLTPSVVSASSNPLGQQVQTRSIKMSTSAPGAPAQYDVTFTLASSYTLKGIVIDFCSGDPLLPGSPIIGDSTCASPAGFSLGTPTYTNNPDGTGNVALTAANGWAATAINSGHAFQLASSTGAAVTNTSIVNFSIDTITNSTYVGTFYARAITYTTNTPPYGGPGNEGTYQDYGGFALSTANLIQITAKVQETLVFCTSGALIDGSVGSVGSDCSKSTAPDLVLGSGTPATINNLHVYAGTVYVQLSTNATTGAIIRMHAQNVCPQAGLSSTGSGAANCTSIPGIDNTTGGGAQAMVAGTPKFGLFVGTGYTTTGNTNSTGAITPSTDYNNPAHVTEGSLDPGLYYGMVNDASGVTSTYGGTIATTGGAPCNTINSHLVFAATAGLTTPAGIYAGNESLIATGTF